MTSNYSLSKKSNFIYSIELFYLLSNKYPIPLIIIIFYHYDFIHNFFHNIVQWLLFNALVETADAILFQNMPSDEFFSSRKTAD